MGFFANARPLTFALPRAAVAVLREAQAEIELRTKRKREDLGEVREELRRDADAVDERLTEPLRESPWVRLHAPHCRGPS
jgi:hypothetical protein